MKKIIIIFTVTIILFSCNVNPNKEARIQVLEVEIQTINDQLVKIGQYVKTLESANEQLTDRIVVLEKR